MRYRFWLVPFALSWLALAPSARADQAVPGGPDDELLQAYPNFRAVGVILDTGQALLWDEGQRVYRIARVGEDIDGWKVVSVATDKVVLMLPDGIRDVLPMTRMPAPLTVGNLVAPARAPAAPRPPASELLSLFDEDSNSPAKPIPVLPKAEPPVPAPQPKIKVVEQDRALSRRDLNREISDFDRLLHAVGVTLAPQGVVLERLDEKSFWYTMGLRQGDVVTAVAGERIASVDDAARVYARLQSIDSFDIELLRGGKPHILHYRVRK